VMIAEGLTQNIVASTRSEKTLQDAKALGLIQQGYSDPVQAVQGADLVVLALPVRATQKVLETIKPYLQEHTIITDVGSTKGNVVDAAKAVYGEALPVGFVPGIQLRGQNIQVCMQVRSIYLQIIK